MTNCKICEKPIGDEISWKDPLLPRSQWQYFHFNCLMRGIVGLLNIPPSKNPEPLQERKIKVDHGIFENKRRRKYDDNRTNL